MGKRRPLTIEEMSQAKALSAAGMTPHAIGQEIGRDPKTIRAFIRNPETREEIEEIQAKLATQFEDVATKMLASIKDEDINKAPADKRVIAACAAVDKSRTIRGLANANIAVAGVIVTTACPELLKLLDGGTE